jgi:F-box protein 21
LIIDALTRIRSVEDKSVRYVAEENIEVIKPTLSQLPGSLLGIAGKHFKRWDEEERRFVSNIQDEYPDG